MGVKSEWYGDQFEEGFFDAISKELVKSASILRRNLSNRHSCTFLACIANGESFGWEVHRRSWNKCHVCVVSCQENRKRQTRLHERKSVLVSKISIND